VINIITRDGQLFQRSIMHSYNTKFTVALDELIPTEYDSLFELLSDCTECETCLQGLKPLHNSPYPKYFRVKYVHTPTNNSSDSTSASRRRASTTAAAAQPTLPQQRPRQTQPQQPNTAQQRQPVEEQNAHQRHAGASVRDAPRHTAPLESKAVADRQAAGQRDPRHAMTGSGARTSTAQRRLANRSMSLVSAARNASSYASRSTTPTTANSGRHSISKRRNHSVTSSRQPLAAVPKTKKSNSGKRGLLNFI